MIGQLKRTRRFNKTKSTENNHTFCNILHPNIEHSIVQRSAHQEFQTQVCQWSARASQSPSVFSPYSKLVFGQQEHVFAESCSIRSPNDHGRREQCLHRPHCKEWSVICGCLPTKRSNPLFVAVEQRPCQSRLNVLHSLAGKLIARFELLRRLTVQVSTPCFDRIVSNCSGADHLRISSS